MDIVSLSFSSLSFHFRFGDRCDRCICQGYQPRCTSVWYCNLDTSIQTIHYLKRHQVLPRHYRSQPCSAIQAGISYDERHIGPAASKRCCDSVGCPFGTPGNITPSWYSTAPGSAWSGNLLYSACWAYNGDTKSTDQNV